MFYIIGLLNGIEQSLSYQNGSLSGDKEALQKAKEENLKLHGFLGDNSEKVDKKYLDYEMPAFNLVKEFVFDKVIKIKMDKNVD